MRARPRYNYSGLLSYLDQGRNKNDRPTDKHSLRIVRTHEGPAVQMYRTRIATFHENGTITIDLGGYEDSVTTRANVGEVAGVSVFTIAQHKKRAINNSTRIYASGLPSGLPYVRGCIVERGSVIWHPDMKEQGVDDVRKLTEEKLVINKEKAAPYYKARKALLKRIKPMLHFIDAEVVSNAPHCAGHRLMDWLEDVLFNPPGDDDLMVVACQLVDLGKPNNSGNWWKKGGFDVDKVGDYVQRGLTKCVGASSWDFLGHIGALDTVPVRCMDV